MAVKLKSLVILSILFFLICVKTTPSFAKPAEKDDDDEDVSFLEEDDGDDALPSHDHEYGHQLHDFENYDDLNDDDAPSYGGEDSAWDDEPTPAADVDEKDVVVLKESNFSDFIGNNKYVMVEFYAPWCGHCQALAPEYAAAATELKSGGNEGPAVLLAKVDATEDTELTQKYEVQGFPTVYFFVDGVHKPYNGERTKEAIVAWVKKKTGPALFNLTTTEDAEKILAAGKPVVLGFLNTLVGSENGELAAAAKLEDDVDFYQTTCPDVAKLFHIDPEAKRPAVVVIKKEAERINHFDGEFTKSAIADFVLSNKFPLVINLTRETAPQVFENPIKKQLILFATSKDSEKFLPVFKEAVKAFKGKVVSVYVELDNEEVGKPVAEYFGVSETASNVLAYTGNEDARKFLLEGEISSSNIQSFAESFLQDNLKPFYKSDPIPEKNDGDVKIVVGNNFDEIVLDESKDVLLEIYAPWCGHCQSLEPIYNKLGKHLKGIDSLVIAKMDGTTNEHPRAKADGFPTILFFPAGNKSFDPITVDTDRTVVAFYKFLKKHASIPFKLQKPAKTQKAEESSDATKSHDETQKVVDSEATKKQGSDSSDLKDEL